MAIVDGLVVFLAGIIIYLVYVGWSNESAPVYASGCAITALLTTAAFYVFGLYELNTLANRAIRYRKLVVGCGWVFVFIIVLGFALNISAGFSRVWLFSWYISSTLLIVAARGFGDSQLRRCAISGRLSRNVVIVGATGLAARLIKVLENRKEPWIRILGIFDDRENRRPSNSCRYPVLGNLNNLLDCAREYRIDDIVIALPWSAEDHTLALIEKLRILPARVHLCPDAIGFNFVQAGYSYLGGLPVLNVVQKPVSGWNYVAKTIEDRVLAALFLVLTLPVLGLIAACIKLDSPGAVFFRQKRYGFNRQLIDVIKFRTLYVEQQDDDADQLVTHSDPRVTRVGSFLRRTSLDELPQLLNVLRGDMSIVGPRPHAIHASAGGRLYEEVVEKYAIRHKVKPGITGWAQINGWRGETDTEEKIRGRVEHDFYYIENWSLMLDLVIVLRTAWVVLKGSLQKPR
ncbi:MAG: undecaprenyl-phosphate glucose phosphotransferase [Gammaproteobacteria bacterium]